MKYGYNENRFGLPYSSWKAKLVYNSLNNCTEVEIASIEKFRITSNSVLEHDYDYGFIA